LRTVVFCVVHRTYIALCAMKRDVSSIIAAYNAFRAMETAAQKENGPF